MPGLKSIAAALTSQINERTRGAALIELDKTTDAPTGEAVRFQYFPDSISSDKTVNYQQKTIPGGSLPLYQWIGSGEHTIGFTAVFTTDIDLGLVEDNAGAQQALVERIKSMGQARHNPDIRSAIAWLRQYMLPSYGEEGTYNVTMAPAKLILWLPGSGIGLAGGDDGRGGGIPGRDSIYCVMTSCGVNYDKFFPSGLPRIATVSLSFAQIPQRFGAVMFPAVTDAYKREIYAENVYDARTSLGYTSIMSGGVAGINLGSGGGF